LKRVILTGTATVAGLVALLSFKTQTQPVSAATLPTASASTGTDDSSSTTTTAKSKSYTGEAVTTRYGIIQVEVTVKNSKITDVSFKQLTAFDGHSQEINSWAGPQLLQETLTNQNSQVDAVSGATYTSDGYRTSLQSALDQAGLT
jgi:uncharacterized protein with FMN-binding domain